MAYLFAWGIYLLMAALFMFAFERYLAGWIAHRQLRLLARALLAVVLFTPGAVSADRVYVVPACIGVLFNILAHSGPGLLKAALPLLFSATLVFAVLFLREALRKETASPEDEADDVEA